MNDYDFLQKMVADEARRRWPNLTTMSEVACLFEEGGEVARCVLKASEGTRGTKEEWHDQLRLEIGQTLFALINIAHLEGLTMSECIETAWTKFVAKPMREDMEGNAVV